MSPAKEERSSDLQLSPEDEETERRFENIKRGKRCLGCVFLKVFFF